MTFRFYAKIRYNPPTKEYYYVLMRGQYPHTYVPRLFPTLQKAFNAALWDVTQLRLGLHPY